MERAAPHVTGWPAEILGFGDRDMPDAAHDVSAWVAANAGTYGIHRHAHGLDIRVPDYSTLSRRANGLSIAQAMRQAGSIPVHLVVDSTGLKILGEGEWLAQKHKIKEIRRRWRKLHLGRPAWKKGWTSCLPSTGLSCLRPCAAAWGRRTSSTALIPGMRIRTRRVGRRRNGQMVLRWAASAFLATEEGFRRIQGCRDLWMLQAKLNDAVTGDDKSKVA